jgi:hypothetical protein
MIRLLLAAALPIAARAQTVRGPVELPAPMAALADPKVEANVYPLLSDYAAAPDDQLGPQLDSLVQTLESQWPEKRAAARVVLWAVAHGVETFQPDFNIGVQNALIEASRRTRVLRARNPALNERLEAESRRVELVSGPSALAKVEPAEPPALAANKTKLRTTRLESIGGEFFGGWEEEFTSYERGIEALNDRDSELAAYFHPDSNLGWRANGALGKALTNVRPTVGRPLVAATHLHEASRKLDEPGKAQLMLRFIDAAMHPDFKRPADERRLTTMAVTALYDKLGWGSTPVEQAIRRHLDARAAGQSVASAPAASVGETALTVIARATSPMPMEIPSDTLVFRLLGAVLAGVVALGGIALGSVPVIAAGLLALIAIAFRSIGDEPAAIVEKTDPDLAAAMKELDAEFPTHSDARVDARFRVLLESNHGADEIEPEEEEQLREKVRRLDEDQGK